MTDDPQNRPPDTTAGKTRYDHDSRHRFYAASDRYPQRSGVILPL